jgi:xylan 1,4-beta-xylosidase
VVRVGGDFYLVNSTFQYQPAIVISQSTDLVNWRQVGHVFDRRNPLDLGHFYDGCGVWAPDISFHDGMFYVFYCLVQLTRDRAVNVRGNYMVKARSIRGPWTEPVRLTDYGNDPSHFVDEDGAHYLLFAGGVPRGDGTWVARLRDDCSALAEEPRWLSYGPQRRAPEGPHIFKREGWYYHTMASQGGYAEGHHQIVARARGVYGPYEASPYNPLIVEASGGAVLQGPGHAKLLEDKRGDWWAVYLCSRRPEGVATLGRETALSRVVWSEDGWPRLEGGAVPRVVGVMPQAQGYLESRGDGSVFRDDFDGATLGCEWQGVRELPETFTTMRVRPGWVGVSTSERVGAVERRHLLLVRETCHEYVATMRMSFEPDDGCEAGMACYYDSATNITLGVRMNRGERWVELRQCRQGAVTVVARVPMRRVGTGGSAMVELRVVARGLVREFYARRVGRQWVKVGGVEHCAFLSDDGTPGWGFTGTMVGMYGMATRDVVGDGGIAYVDWFEVRTREAVGQGRRAKVTVAKQ